MVSVMTLTNVLSQDDSAGSALLMVMLEMIYVLLYEWRFLKNFFLLKRLLRCSSILMADNASCWWLRWVVVMMMTKQMMMMMKAMFDSSTQSSSSPLVRSCHLDFHTCAHLALLFFGQLAKHHLWLSPKFCILWNSKSYDDMIFIPLSFI